MSNPPTFERAGGSAPSASAETETRVGLDDGDQWALLAGLRFLLALIVVLGHTSDYFVGAHDWIGIGLWLNQEGSVYGFFLISGYSIAASLERSAKGYYLRRMQRIWPLYLATILLGLASILITKTQFATPLGPTLTWPGLPVLLGTLLMLQTIVTPAIGYIGPTWSLSLEWWLYMVAPLLKRLPSIALAAIITLSAWRFTVHFSLDFGTQPILSLAWLWIVGFLYHRHRDHRASSLILSVPCMIVWHFGGTLYLATILTVVALTLCRDIKIPSAPLRRALIWLGDLSYPLYLAHLPIMIALSYYGVRSSLVLVAGSIVAATAMLQLIDLPLRRRERRLAVAASARNHQ